MSKFDKTLDFIWKTVYNAYHEMHFEQHTQQRNITTTHHCNAA